MSIALIMAVAAAIATNTGGQETTLTVALVGDSTVMERTGWGRAFPGRFKDSVKVLDFAIGGNSSKRWHDQQGIKRVLQAKPDYVFIQFGHNDQPHKGPDRATDPATTFRDYLRFYVKEFRAIGAKPVLVSPVVRRTFDENGKIVSTLTPWAEGAQAVAREMNVPFIDLHTASMNYHNTIGREASMAFNMSEGDTTHFNPKGAEAIVDLIVAQLKTAVPELASYLK